MNEDQLSEAPEFPTKPFLLLLLALAVIAGVSLVFTAWCWPRYGEQACGRYVLPVDFVMSLVIFTLVALVFDQPWGRLILYGLAISAAMILGSLVGRLILRAPALPFRSALDFLNYLAGALMRLIYPNLLQVLVPAAVLRGLLRRDWERITLPSAAAFGVMIGVIFTLFFAGLFWLASVIQPGSVAPGYIFTWNDFLSALTLGLAACLGVLLGKALRTL